MSQAAEIRAALLDTLAGAKIHEAEKRLQQFDPMVLVTGMLELVQDADVQVVQLALIHLRRVINELTNHDMGDAGKAAMRQFLSGVPPVLFGLMQAPVMCLVLITPVAELLSLCGMCSPMVGDDGPILEMVMSFIQESIIANPGAAPPAVAVIGMQVMGRMAFLVHEFYKRHTADYASTLVPALAAGLQHTDARVRLATSACVARLIDAIDSSDDGSNEGPYAPLLSHMASALSTFLAEGDDASARDVLTHLIELSVAAPIMFRDVAEGVAGMVQSLITGPEYADEIQAGAVELGVALCQCAPKMMRAIPGFMGAFFPSLVRLLADLEDDTDAWLTTDDPTLTDEGRDFGSVIQRAEVAIDDVTLAMGGETILPVLEADLGGLVSSSNWKERHAGIVAVGIIAEGVRRTITPAQVEALLDLAIAHQNDPHPRVRWACLNTLGHMAGDMSEIVLAKFGDKVVGALLAAATADGETDRVRSHAVSAISNFALHADPTDVRPYLDDILTVLAGMLTSPRLLCQRQAVSTLGDVAVAAEDDFARHYPSFMPGLIGVLQASTGPQDGPLRARTIQAITAVGLSAGREIFRAGARRVMAILQAQMAGGLLQASGGDDLLTYYHGGYMGLSKALKNDFAPFVDVVMPQLIGCIQQDGRLTSSVPPEGASEDNTWDIGGEKLYARTAILDEIVSGLRTVAIILRYSPLACVPMIPTIMQASIDKMGYYHSEEARAEAVNVASAVVCVLSAAHKANPHTGMDVTRPVKEVVGHLLDVFGEEDCPDVIEAVVASFTRMIRRSRGTDIMKPHMEDALRLGAETDIACRLQLTSALAPGSDELYDEADREGHAEEVVATTDSVSAEVTALYTAVLQSWGDRVLHRKVKVPTFGKRNKKIPFRDHIGTVMSQWLSGNDNTMTSALVLAAGLAQYTPQAAGPFIGDAVQAALAAIGDAEKFSTLRQLAFFLVGHAAVAAPQVLAPHMEHVIVSCHAQMARAGDSTAEATVSDNAASCLARVAQSTLVDSDTSARLLSEWFAVLPLTRDMEEASAANLTLLSLVQAGSPLVMGDALGHVVFMLAKAYQTKATKYHDPELSGGIRALLAHCSTAAPQALAAAQEQMAALGSPFAEKIHEIMQ